MKKRRWAIRDNFGYYLDCIGSDADIHDGTLLFARQIDAVGFIDCYCGKKSAGLKPVRLRSVLRRELRAPPPK